MGGGVLNPNPCTLVPRPFLLKGVDLRLLTAGLERLGSKSAQVGASSLLANSTAKTQVEQTQPSHGVSCMSSTVGETAF